MTDAVIVGIDSGGTRTNVEIAIEGETATRRSYEVSHALSGSLAPDQYASCMRRILAPLDAQLDGVDPSLPVYAFFSAAGFTRWVRDDFVDAMMDVCPDFADGRIVAAGAANDAVSLLLGMRSQGVVIAGTGSNVVVRTPDGDVYQVGGHEWVACDYGSAFWIGLRALRQAYRDFEAGNESVLLQRLYEQYSIRPGDERRLTAKLRDLAIADANTKREIARFAADVCQAAERGDLEAQNIVKAEAEDLADVMAGGLRRRYTTAQLAEGIDLVQCGSVLNNEFYRTSFEAQIEMRLRSPSAGRSEIRWQRVATGGQAALNLARDLQDAAEDLGDIDLMFRPVVVRF